MKATTRQTQDRLEELADDYLCAHRLVEALDDDVDRDTVSPQDVLTTLRIEPALAVVTLNGTQELLTYAPTEDGTAEYLVLAGDGADEEFTTVGRRRACDLLRSGDVALGLTDDPQAAERDASATPSVGGGSA